MFAAVAFAALLWAEIKVNPDANTLWSMETASKKGWYQNTLSRGIRPNPKGGFFMRKRDLTILALALIIAVVGNAVGGILVDHFIFGLNIKRRVCIISPKIDEILPFILHDLHSGASINEIIGAYDNTVRREVITIVDKQEYRRLMDFVKRVDPKAFVTVYSVNEIRYQPKV